MQRVNEYQFYLLGTVLHPLADLQPEVMLKDVYWKLWTARAWLEFLLGDKLVPLVVCKPTGERLLRALQTLTPPPEESAAPDQEKKLDVSEVYTITSGVREFETVFSAELQSLSSYFVSQKLAYQTRDLIENAERILPERIVATLPEQALSDIRQTGRCVVFDLPTAAGFHIMRAIESVIRMYCDVVASGKPRSRNWGKYIEVLKKKGADGKVLSVLDQLREMHRNPIMHPEVVLTMDEATTLLGIAQAAIVAMVNDMERRRGAPGSAPPPARR